ncbi:MAG TPA: MarR family transcriptional regulator [Candidatus Saccharimonadales bacterium]|nr:MarR family transcriptional regulator [Candidatus Saccharimonadales bacterium]
MKTQALESSIYWQMVQVAVRVKHDLGRLAETYDLTNMQVFTLCSLSPSEDLPMNRLSHLLACDASNVTGIVDRLVQRGLITRAECETDRRVKVISLTESGRQLREVMIEEIVSNRPPTMSVLSEKELEQFDYLLTKALTKQEKDSQKKS